MNKIGKPHKKQATTNLKIKCAVMVGLFSIIGATSGTVMAKTPEPNFSILEQEGDFELRLYDPKIIAQTEVEGDFNSASRQGFKVLADYIFGNNTRADGGNTDVSHAGKGDSTKISMTAPVIMTPTTNENNQSAKISMTAPVAMSKEAGKWQVTFVMPDNYTMQSIPKPNNPAVTLLQMPEQRYAVVKFSGLAGEQKVAEKTLELQNWMNTKSIEAKGAPELARYNPPWTLPFLRRNEIMIAY